MRDRLTRVVKGKRQGERRGNAKVGGDDAVKRDQKKRRYQRELVDSVASASASGDVLQRGDTSEEALAMVVGADGSSADVLWLLSLSQALSKVLTSANAQGTSS
jgi:hypothetical protein